MEWMFFSRNANGISCAVFLDLEFQELMDSSNGNSVSALDNDASAILCRLIRRFDLSLRRFIAGTPAGVASCTNMGISKFPSSCFVPSVSRRFVFLLASQLDGEFRQREQQHQLARGYRRCYRSNAVWCIAAISLLFLQSRKGSQPATTQAFGIPPEGTLGISHQKLFR